MFRLLDSLNPAKSQNAYFIDIWVGWVGQGNLVFWKLFFKYVPWRIIASVEGKGLL